MILTLFEDLPELKCQSNRRNYLKKRSVRTSIPADLKREDSLGKDAFLLFFLLTVESCTFSQLPSYCTIEMERKVKRTK